MADEEPIDIEQDEYVEPELIDESLLEEVVEEPTQEEVDYKAEAARLAQEKAELERKLNGIDKPSYNQLQSERDRLAKQYAGLVKSLKDKNIAEYDETSGAVIVYADRPAEPVDRATQLKNEITKRQNDNENRYDSGEITETEYRAENNKITELRDELIIERVKPTGVKPKEPAMVVPDVVIDNPIIKQFDALAEEYPDSINESSLLFSKMVEIYNANPSKYQKANDVLKNANGEAIGYGDPAIRELLIERAANALIAENKIKREDIKKATKTNFTTVTSTTPPAVSPKKTFVTKDHHKILQTGGFIGKDKTRDAKLLNTVNKALEELELTGSMTFE